MSKKLLLLSVIGMLNLTACQNDENDISLEPEDEVYYAEIEGIESVELKTTVKLVADKTYKSAWNSGDKYAVFNTISELACFYLKSDLSVGKLSGKVTSPKTIRAYAYYPYEGFKGFINGELVVKLDSVQKYVSSEQLQSDSYPMACWTDNTTFSFKNVAAIMNVRVLCNDTAKVYVKSIELSSSEINMCGMAKVTIDENNIPTLVMDPVDSNGPKSITIDCVSETNPKGVILEKGKPIPFHMVVPPHYYKGGTLFYKINTNRGSYKFTTSNSNNFEIKRSTGNNLNKSLNLTLSAGGTGVVGEIAD